MLGTYMDKNFGFFGRYLAEIWFFGEPRKEKCTEISFVRFFPIFSQFFPFVIFCFKNLKKLFLVGFKPTQNSWKWHTPTTKPLIALIIYSANFFYIILLFLFYIITYNIFKSNINFKMKRSKIILFKNLKL